jgi:hypothetical protein
MQQIQPVSASIASSSVTETVACGGAPPAARAAGAPPTLDQEDRTNTCRDAAYCAGRVGRVHLEETPPDALNLNVNGRRLVGPVQGFGRLWEKTYRVELPGTDLTPAEVVATWKEGFGRFWPPKSQFYGPAGGIAPGQVVLLNATVGGGVTVATGILVLHSDQESFTFMTPQGHLFAAWITFSAVRDVDSGPPLAQIRILLRADDPFYELLMPVALSRLEDRMWQRTLSNLARYLGVAAPRVTTTVRCLDRRRQWRYAANVWYNAAIRSGLYAPVELFRSRRRRRPVVSAPVGR